MKLSNVQKAKARLLLQQPFYASLLMSMPLIESDKFPTAATDMERIYYNPAFFDTLSVEEIQFVLVHEVLHVAHMHGLRVQTRNRLLWNIAADYAINLICAEAGMAVVKGALLDRKYKGMSAEQIYEKLQQDMKAQCKPQPGSGLTGGIPKELDGGSMGGDLQEPEDSDPAETARVQQRITQAVAQAANVARLAGKSSADIERLVGSVLNPTIPWRDLLRDFMTRTSRDDESWSRRNRRFQTAYLPARHSTRMGEIVVIGDTSGSISNDDFGMIAAEVQSIAEQMQPELVRVVWADAAVKGEEVFEPGEPISLRPVGGGGTDMRVPLAYVEQYDPQITVLITDGYTPWPSCDPDYPLIVVCTTPAQVPIGTVVYTKPR